MASNSKDKSKFTNVNNINGNVGGGGKDTNGVYSVDLRVQATTNSSETINP
jgi:hypothetical protein